jgi:serine/threonine protein kinase
MSPFPSITGFELTALLGRGRMATVYAARQPALGREVAIKVVEAKGEDAAQYLPQLENEAQSLAGLHRPSIVALYEFGRTGESAYYVMPMLDGGDLTRLAKTCRTQRVWGSVRSVFCGRNTGASIERRCDGRFALSLDGQGRTTRAFDAAGPSTTAVLLREVRSGIR